MDHYFERFLGLCEDADSSLRARDYEQLMRDIARVARDKAETGGLNSCATTVMRASNRDAAAERGDS